MIEGGFNMDQIQGANPIDEQVLDYGRSEQSTAMQPPQIVDKNHRVSTQLYRSLIHDYKPKKTDKIIQSGHKLAEEFGIHSLDTAIEAVLKYGFTGAKELAGVAKNIGKTPEQVYIGLQGFSYDKIEQTVYTSMLDSNTVIQDLINGKYANLCCRIIKGIYFIASVDMDQLDGTTPSDTSIKHCGLEIPSSHPEVPVSALSGGLAYTVDRLFNGHLTEGNMTGYTADLH